jgi:hypothetical protein
MPAGRFFITRPTGKISRRIVRIVHRPLIREYLPQLIFPQGQAELPQIIFFGQNY